jgi:hypothetical protein
VELYLSRAQWRKSSYSGNTGNCVEVAKLDRVTAVRDSMDRKGPRLLIKNDRWQIFIKSVKAQTYFSE